RQLQETHISILAGALEGDTATRFMRPTLYDFLAQRAGDFFMNEESSLQPRPEENYLFDNPVLFAGAAAFAVEPVQGRDSLSLALRALELLQELSVFHLSDEDPSALIDVTLTRLQYVHRKSLLADKDS